MYSGVETKYRQDGLNSGTIYAYTIEVVNFSGDVVDTVSLQTGTKNVNLKQLNDENPLMELIITTIVKQSYIKLIWDEIENISEYNIIRNGETLGAVSEPLFIDGMINLNTDYTYEIQAKRKLSNEKLAELQYYIKINNFTLSNEEMELLLYDQFSIQKEISDLKQKTTEIQNIEKDFQLLAEAVNKEWDIRYNTFIPMEYAENPWDFLSPIKFFGGDNRSWNVSSTKYRTSVDVKVCYCTPYLPTVTMTKKTGATKGYDSKKVLLSTETASDSGITLSNIIRTNTSMKFDIKHASGNPLVPSPDIDYKYTGEFQSNGNYKITGQHDQAPNHEVYMKGSNSTTWETMRQREIQSFNHLFPTWPNYSWTKSNF